jgi:hypothetical protein
MRLILPEGFVVDGCLKWRMWVQIDCEIIFYKTIPFLMSVFRVQLKLSLSVKLHF